LPAYAVAVLWRSVALIRRPPKARVAVASTHFLFDVAPAAVMRWRHGTRVAAYVYHLVRESGRTNGLRNWISTAAEWLSLALLRRTADVVFVDNAETMSALRERGFRPDQLVMTENAYDPLEPLPPREDSGDVSVLFIGRLVEAKGVRDVLALARTLQRVIPAARVSLLGDGPLRSELERAVASEQLTNIELVGFVSEAEKWRRLRSATLFVAPSREEGWGIAVGEALTAGVPAVVYDLPAYRHFGELPVRVPTGDTEAFVQAATDLLADPHTLERSRRSLEHGTAGLPRWDAILARELAELQLVGAG
jgi:glycosyltransferase involved in cell wall biosynthesis